MNESIINKKEVNWNNIFILEEFFIYFNINLLKYISLLSPIVRNKLNFILFSKACLIGTNLINYIDKKSLNSYQVKEFHIYTEYLKYRWTDLKLEEISVENGNNNSGMKYLNKELNTELERIGYFIRSLEFNSLFHLSYYIFPLNTSLINITQLKIQDCTLSLLKFLNIGECLSSLQLLKLNCVNFIELVKQEISPNDFIFHSTLKDLSFNFIKVVSYSKISSINYFIQNRNNLEYNLPIQLQVVNLSNLKRLHFGYIDTTNFIHKLLKQCSELEELTIDSDELEEKDLYQISSMNNLTKLVIESVDIGFPKITKNYNEFVPKFNNIRELRLIFRYTEQSNIHDFQIIANYFPNLTSLTLNLFELNFEEFYINQFFTLNLPLLKLSNLTLTDYASIDDDSDYYQFKINWQNVINVNCLIIELNPLRLSDIEFSKFSPNLREFRLRSFKLNEDFEYFKNIDYISNNWNIEVKGCYIYFSK